MVAISDQGFDALNSQVELTHGINSIQLDVAGLTISDVRVSFISDMLNVRLDTPAYLGTNRVSDHYVLRPNDRVEFVRDRGRKGSSEKQPDDEFNYLPLNEARKLLPGRKDGSRLSLDTIWRWCMVGVGDGIRLKSVLIGGRRFTTRPWLKEFIEIRSQMADDSKKLAPVPRTNQKRSSDADYASQQLRALWRDRKRRF